MNNHESAPPLFPVSDIYRFAWGTVKAGVLASVLGYLFPFAVFALLAVIGSFI